MRIALSGDCWEHLIAESEERMGTSMNGDVEEQMHGCRVARAILGHLSGPNTLAS